MSGATDLPLTELGRHEAELVAGRLADEHAAEAIYTSPLTRARDTAEAIGRRRRAHLELREDLREIDCGIVDGLPIDEVAARYPDAWQRNLRQDDPSFRWPEGESYEELRARCLRAARAIAAAHGKARVIVVTHAGVISQLLGFVDGESPARWERFRPSNASITEIDWREDQCVVARFDDRQHLTTARPLVE